MPEWGGTDILNSKGKEDAAAQASAFDRATQQQAATTDPLATTSAASDNETSPGNPADGNNPGGVPTPPYKQTLDANGGPSSPPPGPGRWHWDNVGKHWVSDDYSQDGNGRVLTPAERQAAIDADHLRASQTAARLGAGGGASTSNTTGNAVYDPITQTYSMVDKDGVWTYGIKVADLQAKLSDNLKKQYSDWWWGQYASQQNQARRQELEAGAFDAQKFAGMGQQSVRYGPTNF